MNAAPLMGVVLLSACAGVEPRVSSGEPCEIDAEAGVAPPPSVLEVRTGMSYHDLATIFGAESYSPTAGQYYFDGESSGGDCVISGSGGLKNACTLVVEFRVRIEGQRDTRLTDRVTGCWWGGIGE